MPPTPEPSTGPSTPEAAAAAPMIEVPKVPEVPAAAEEPAKIIDAADVPKAATETVMPKYEYPEGTPPPTGPDTSDPSYAINKMRAGSPPVATGPDGYGLRDEMRHDPVAPSQPSPSAEPAVPEASPASAFNVGRGRRADGAPEGGLLGWLKNLRKRR